MMTLPEEEGVIRRYGIQEIYQFLVITVQYLEIFINGVDTLPGHRIS
jgi:hypothetical protein